MLEGKCLQVRSQGPRPAGSAGGSAGDLPVSLGVLWAAHCPFSYSTHSCSSSQGPCLMPTLLLWTDKLISSSAKNQRLSGRKPLKFLFPPPSPLQLISLSTWPHRFPHPPRKRHLICPAHGSFDLKPRLSHPHLLWLCLALSVVSSFISFTSILLLSYTPRLVLFPHSYKKRKIFIFFPLAPTSWSHLHLQCPHLEPVLSSDVVTSLRPQGGACPAITKVTGTTQTTGSNGHLAPSLVPLYINLFLKICFFSWCGLFQSLYWICYRIASVLRSGFFWLHGMWDLSSPTRDQTCIPSIGRQSLNHWNDGKILPFWILLPHKFHQCSSFAMSS